MRRWLAGGVVGLAATAGCDNTLPDDPGGIGGERIKVEVVLAGASFPVAIAFAPDGRIFFTEKNSGQIRIIRDGALLPVPFATVPVNSIGERGLLGIALHPEFASNGWVYVYYTRAGGTALGASDNRVVRFTADGDAADGGETLIVSLPVSAATNHNGGNIRFGPDGKLYVTIGELADAPAAQDLSRLQGKVLRYNDDGSIPGDGPFGPDSPVFALGLRNSFDFAFDPVSGSLFATENGPASHDEINRIEPRGNFGWPRVLGPADDAFGGPAGELAFAAATPNYQDPLLDINPVTVPTGIDFAPNALFGAELEHAMFYGEYLSGRVWRVELSAERDGIAGRSMFVTGVPDGINDVAFAPDGSMYVLTSTTIYWVTPR